jgi:hypothetical protein
VSNLEPRLEVEAEEEQRRDHMQQRHTQIDGFIKERMEDYIESRRCSNYKISEKAGFHQNLFGSIYLFLCFWFSSDC